MITEIYGLVLAGGRSLRMGKDKGLINWFGKPQKYYLADLLKEHCDKVFISCRANQTKQIDAGYPIIIDKKEYSDSYGAIMSALSKYPDKAWLVVACDMPFVDNQSVQDLVKKRDPQKMSTAYFNPANGLPEPMFAIWEPKSLGRLQQLLKSGISCPRKALIKSSGDTNLIKPSNAMSITNVNTPAEAEKVWVAISGHS